MWKLLNLHLGIRSMCVCVSLFDIIRTKTKIWDYKFFIWRIFSAAAAAYKCQMHMQAHSAHKCSIINSSLNKWEIVSYSFQVHFRCRCRRHLRMRLQQCHIFHTVQQITNHYLTIPILFEMCTLFLARGASIQYASLCTFFSWWTKWETTIENWVPRTFHSFIWVNVNAQAHNIQTHEQNIMIIHYYIVNRKWKR